MGVVGDLVADVYVSGQSDRVSREAPVLIVRYEREWLRPGGAANVAANIAALGATACLVGMVGDDDVGHKLLGLLGSTGGQAASCTHGSGTQAASGTHVAGDAKAASGAGLGGGAEVGGSVECSRVLQTAGRATISKTRFLAGAKLTQRQQVLRLDRQPPKPPDAKLIRSLRDKVAEVDGQVDAWVASDYGYGGFDQKLRDLLREIAGRKPVLADSRWELTRFAGLTLLKPNEEEARAAAHELGLAASDEVVLAGELAARLEAQGVLITMGNKGMALSSQGQVMRVNAVGTEEIVDLTGAGDSVAATLATAIAAGTDFQTAARLANYAGSVVVMKEGAATASPDELREAIEKR